MCALLCRALKIIENPDLYGLRLKLPMPKLPIISGKKLVAALKKVGFAEVRQRGSHISMEKVHSKPRSSYMKIDLDELNKDKENNFKATQGIH